MKESIMLRNRFATVLVPSFLSIAVAVLAACRADPYPGAVDRWSGTNYPNINVLEGMKDDVQFDVPSVIPSSAERPLSVSVATRNATSRDLSIQYRYTFLDKYDREVMPDSGWRFVTIGSSTQARLMGSAIDNTAVSWRLDVRPAR
jgi:hypothetical protein